jgi:hypothetical protein
MLPLIKREVTIDPFFLQFPEEFRGMEKEVRRRQQLYPHMSAEEVFNTMTDLTSYDGMRMDYLNLQRVSIYILQSINYKLLGKINTISFIRNQNFLKQQSTSLGIRVLGYKNISLCFTHEYIPMPHF